MYRFRNTQKVAAYSKDLFEEARSRHLVGGFARTTKKPRSIFLEPTGREVVDFSRCGYLGLDEDARLLEGACSVMRDIGSTQWSAGSTRIRHVHYKNLENNLHSMTGGHPVLFSSVSSASFSAIPLIGSGVLFDLTNPVMVFDEFCHASMASLKPIVADETQVETIRHNDMEALEAICRGNDEVVYICDGVYSMGGIAPFNEMVSLQSQYGLGLYIDDAHGVSISGGHGRGVALSSLAEHLTERTAVALSLSKGFGASGAAIVVQSEAQQHLLQHFGQTYALGNMLSSANLGMSLASSEIHLSNEISVLQDRLREHILYFDLLYPTIAPRNDVPIRMIPIGDERRAIAIAEELTEEGVLVSATFFPTVGRGNAHLRVCISAAHTRCQIEALADKLDRVVKGSAIVERSMQA